MQQNVISHYGRSSSNCVEDHGSHTSPTATSHAQHSGHQVLGTKTILGRRDLMQNTHVTSSPRLPLRREYGQAVPFPPGGLSRKQDEQSPPGDVFPPGGLRQPSDRMPVRSTRLLNKNIYSSRYTTTGYETNEADAGKMECFKRWKRCGCLTFAPTPNRRVSPEAYAPSFQDFLAKYNVSNPPPFLSPASTRTTTGSQLGIQGFRQPGGTNQGPVHPFGLHSGSPIVSLRGGAGGPLVDRSKHRAIGDGDGAGGDDPDGNRRRRDWAKNLFHRAKKRLRILLPRGIKKGKASGGKHLTMVDLLNEVEKHFPHEPECQEYQDWLRSYEHFMRTGKGPEVPDPPNPLRAKDIPPSPESLEESSREPLWSELNRWLDGSRRKPPPMSPISQWLDGLPRLPLPPPPGVPHPPPPESPPPRTRRVDEPPRVPPPLPERTQSPRPRPSSTLSGSTTLAPQSSEGDVEISTSEQDIEAELDAYLAHLENERREDEARRERREGGEDDSLN